MPLRVSILSSVLLFGALTAAAQGTAPPAATGGSQLSPQELNKQLNNPVSSVWSLTIQNNFTSLENDSGFDLPGWDDGETEWSYNMNFQPVLPLRLTEKWNLISRPIFSVFADRPVFDDDRFRGRSGFGDMTFFSMLAPAEPVRGHFLWGVGPTFLFPTASPDVLGQEKWQAGPSAVALYLSDKWVIGVLPQHWWSFAGDDSAPDTSQSNIQYFIQRLLPNQWQIGMAPNITIDWKADHDDAVTFPIGLGVGKLLKFGKLPVKFQAELQYAVVHPDDIGQRWNVRFVITPVLPSLVKRTLLEKP